MKKMTLVVLMVLAIATMAVAQKITEAKIYAGEGALSSGLGGVVTAVDSAKETMLCAEFNSTLGQFIFLKNFSSGISIGPSFGTFYKTTWVGPFLTYTPKPAKFITFTSWWGAMAGEVLKPEWKSSFCFAYHSVDIIAGYFGAGFSVLHYLYEKPSRMPTINYSLAYGKSKIYLSATYNLTTDTPLYLVALKQTF